MKKNSIKTKLPLILLVVGLAGCQESLIDKCVKAEAIELCNKKILGEPVYQVQRYPTESECIQDKIKQARSFYRTQCLAEMLDKFGI